jgi:selenide,water dikinase
MSGLREEIRLTSYSHGGGCACKLGTLELAEVLKHVKSTTQDPALLVGLDTPDDAAVYQVAPDMALVQTVDFFTPVVDDPYSWGRIAAANALSDVYAMGGRPALALNLVGWPRSLDFEILGRVLTGAAELCDEAAVTIVGGHSVDDPEPKYGLAATGFVHPERVVRKTGAPPGCDLLLTKPLGIGIITSGIKEGKTSAATAEEAIRVMGTLNRAAAEAMTAVGVEAATDVTGFGLMGHLLQMLGGELDAELNFAAIPVIEEAITLVEQGVFAGGSKRNLEAMSDRVSTDDLDEARARILFDAQTSGGLLIASTPDSTERLMTELHDRGVDSAAVIGRLKEGNGTVTVARA